MTKIFDRMVDGFFAQNEAERKIEEILKLELLGISFDYYDASIEIYPLESEAFVPTADQVTDILELGCQRFWINFEDGQESYMGYGLKPCPLGNKWKKFNRS